MILSNEGIQRALKSGQLDITPLPDPKQYTTSAVDLILGEEFHYWNPRSFGVPGVRVELNLAEQEFKKTADGYLIPFPQESDGSVIFPPFRTVPYHMLAITREIVHLKRGSRIAARVEGRSSFARLGLVVHLTAPTVHSGWNGQITLEMINFGPFHLRLVTKSHQNLPAHRRAFGVGG